MHPHKRMRSLRIAWFHSHLLHINSGGTRFVLDYSEGLHRYHGHDVTIFCDVACAEAARQIRVAGIRLVELDRSSTNSPIYWLTLPYRIRRKRRELKEMMRDQDVIVNSMFPMNWLVCEYALPKLQIC